jgi:hypothetical protein
MTYNQYDQDQLFYLTEAKNLAKDGLEYSHLIKLLSPEYSLRLKLFIQELPKSVAENTIYGKSHWKEQSSYQQKRRG